MSAPGEETTATGVKRPAEDDAAETGEMEAKKAKTEEIPEANTEEHVTKSEEEPTAEAYSFASLLPTPAEAAPTWATPANTVLLPQPTEEIEEPEPPLPSHLDRGVVKWFDLKKGYGFITRDQGEDVFVHQSCLKNTPGYKGLMERQVVWFKTTTEDSGRLRALEVTAPGGKDAKAIPDPEYVVPAEAGMAAPQEKALPAHTTTPLPANRMRGSCKFFNITKGFGFISPEDGSGDVFVHQSQLLSRGQGPGQRSLADGENVEFEISPEAGVGTAKRKASNVTGPGGAYVVGIQVAPSMGMYGMMNPYAAYGYGGMMGGAAAQYAQYYQQSQSSQSQDPAGGGSSTPGNSSSEGAPQDASAAYAAYYREYYAAAAAASQGAGAAGTEGGAAAPGTAGAAAGAGGADPYAAYYQQYYGAYGSQQGGGGGGAPPAAE